MRVADLARELSTVILSSAATRYCLPPVRTTANMELAHLLVEFERQARTRVKRSRPCGKRPPTTGGDCDCQPFTVPRAAQENVYRLATCPISNVSSGAEGIAAAPQSSSALGTHVVGQSSQRSLTLAFRAGRACWPGWRLSRLPDPAAAQVDASRRRPKPMPAKRSSSPAPAAPTAPSPTARSRST